MKKIMDWKRIIKNVLKSTQLAIVMIFVLTVAIGTYGIHLLNDRQKEMEKQMMVSTLAMEQERAPLVEAEKPIQILTEKTQLENSPQEVIPAVTEEEPSAANSLEVETPKWEKKDPTSAQGLSAPCEGIMTRGFGITFDATYEDYRYHDGVDYLVNDEATAIYAAAAGTVSEITNSPVDGYCITLLHEGYRTVYRNLTAVRVEAGEQVEKGAVIGALETAQGILCFVYEESSR